MNEKFVERVRKLLALARHPATPEDEALAAAAKARQLMIEYEISDEAVSLDRSREYIMQVHPVQGFAIWRAVLLQAAAKMYFCEFTLDHRDPAQCQNVWYFGAAKHVEPAISFGEYLEEAVLRRLAKDRPRGFPVPQGFDDSYCLEAAAMLWTRIEELIAKEKAPEVKSPTGSRMLVPVSMALTVHDEFLKKLGAPDGVETVKVQAGATDALGVQLGRRGGKDIGLNRQVGGGAGKGTGLLEDGQ